MEELDLIQLIKDERFINYCFQRNEIDVRYWEDWLMRHPQYTNQIAALKDELLLLAKSAAEKIKLEHYGELKQKIFSSANKAEKLNNTNRLRRLNFHLLRRLAIAGAIVLLFSVGSYYLWQTAFKQTRQVAQNGRQEIHPGSNKAFLTLSNGKNIELSDAAQGSIAREGEVAIKKSSDGSVTYSNSTGDLRRKTDASILNTITTPRGGQWFVELSDGTRVWLNAASSITYPVTFNGKERIVSLTGEAYFEVVHNAAKPFRIKVGDLQIEDLGTSFNVNAYGDEPAVRTTLLEGSVKVLNKEKARILKPGQQAMVAKGSNAIQVKKVAVQDIIGWKNGLTLFENEDLRAIMRQISRWYDVNISYQGEVPDRLFTGGISRKSNLSDLLKILEFEDVNFTVDGKSITVRP